MSSDTSSVVSNGSAIRIIAKTLMLSAVSIILMRNSPQMIGVLVGMVMQAIAFSWLYMVGLDCAKHSFFSRPMANDWVGTLALLPLLRPLQMLRDKSNEGRAFLSLLLHNIFGVSVSHIVLDVGVVVGVPLLWWHVGTWGLMKYWLLPLLVAYVNVQQLKPAPAHACLFPELQRKLRNATVPFYSLHSPQVFSSSSSSASPSHAKGKASKDSNSHINAFAGAESSGSWSPLWNVTREALLWRKRDFLVHAFLLTGALLALFMNPSLRAWATVPVLLLLPLLLVKSRASSIVASVVTTAPTLPASKVFTLEQLRKDTRLAAVQGIVFDLEKFSEHHPGGAHIKACGGTDCTGLFGSMHTYTAPANLKKLAEYQVGTLQDGALPFRFVFDTPFAQELRSRIKEAMAGVSPFAPWSWWGRFVLISVLTLSAELTWALTGSITAMVAVGVLHALIGICIQHDASHGAVSSKSWVNDLVAYGADWIGSNRWLWFQQHIIGHHPHCNIEGQDPDAHSAEPFLQFHWAPNVVKQWFLRHQWVYMYLVLPWYGPTVVYNVQQLLTMNHADEVPSSEWMMDKRYFAVMARLFYVARLVICPVLLAGVSWSVAVLGVPLVTGFCLTFVFVVSHNFEGSDRVPAPKGSDVDFYKLQVETSCSYGGFWSMLFTGGLNMQIEHHLVPRLNSWYYPVIQNAVREACKSHGVRYVYFPTLWENVASTIRYMHFVGEHVTSDEKEEKKSSEERLRIIVHGKYLDVTKWASRHPGGDAVLKAFENRDSTEQFIAMHSDAAKRQLDAMLKSPSLATPVEHVVDVDKVGKAYAELRDELDREGLFDSPKWVEAWHFASNMSFYVIGFVLMRFTSWHWTGALCYGWGMQQSGWLSHDYLHHSVFRNNVKLCDNVGAFLGWLQGYDSDWWKDRHNIHHVCTNEVGHDPDIDLAPLLTYMNQKKIALNHLQKWQHIYFIPLLSLLHFSWLFSSMRFVIQRRLWVRFAALIAHYWVTIMIVYRSSENVFLWQHFVIAMLFKGAMTALYVFSTHYPEVRVPAGANSMSLAQQTFMTSRNIGGGPIVDWMSGSISRQIEHHLFPTLPRVNLAKIAPRVKKMARDLNLPYLETSVWECMKANVSCLTAEQH